MTNLSIPTTFSLDFVSGLTKVNDLISKVRARVYYRGGNRNGTWITSEFAEKLNETLPHVPILGSYNPETEDFEDHFDKGQKKAYGFVPTNTNFQWEVGDDGREYATVDVYLWVGIYSEAAKIINKSQSMELMRETISGDWKVVNGDFYFVYQTGALQGLCTLGDAVTPCFEASAFYSLDEETRSFFASVNEIHEKNPGGNEMNKDVIAVDFEAIVEPVIETVEETAVETVVETVDAAEADAPAETFAEAEAEVETPVEVPAEGADFKYESDSVTIIQDHSESVQNEDGSETYLNTSVVETVSMTTYYELQAENEALKTEVAQLKEFNLQLEVYRQEAITKEKMDVINLFKKRLSEEEISPFVESIDKYTTDELKANLAMVFTNKMLAEPEVEDAPQTNYVAVPTHDNKDGVANILRKHKK